MNAEKERTFTETEEVLMSMNPGMEVDKKIWWDKFFGVFNPTISTIAFLTNVVEYDEEEDKKFQQFVEENDNFYYLEDMEKYVEKYCEGGEFGGVTQNTYNYESLLEDILQYCIFYKNDEAYLLLQIHNGGDARGNYSAPSVFKFIERYDSLVKMFDVCQFSIYCNNCEAYWDFSGGYEQYRNEEGARVPIKDRGYLLDTNLLGESEPTYNIVELKELADYDEYVESEADEDETFEIGMLGIFDEGDELVVKCPCCGEELKLDARLY